MTYRGAEKVKVRGDSGPPDPDEAAALAAACLAGPVSEASAVSVIGAWISKRAELSAGARLTENLAFDLGDAKLRGFVTAALPTIGGALDLPPGVAFFDLSKDQAIELFVIAVQAVQDAAVAASESPVFPLDTTIGDRIPF